MNNNQNDKDSKQNPFENPVVEIVEILDTLCTVLFGKPGKVEKVQEMEKVEEDSFDITSTTSYYIATLANKKGWPAIKMAEFLDSLWEVNPAAVFSTLAKEIAIELDKNYSDHIKNCDTIYIISTFDGRIHEVPGGIVKSFKNFAAFRTKKDAIKACKILRKELKAMFKKSGK